MVSSGKSKKALQKLDRIFQKIMTYKYEFAMVTRELQMSQLWLKTINWFLYMQGWMIYDKDDQEHPAWHYHLDDPQGRFECHEFRDIGNSVEHVQSMLDQFKVMPHVLNRHQGMRSIAGVGQDGKFKAKRDVEGKLWSIKKHMVAVKQCLVVRKEKLMKELKIISMFESRQHQLFVRVSRLELQQGVDQLYPYRILEKLERSSTGERMVAKRERKLNKLTAQIQKFRSDCNKTQYERFVVFFAGDIVIQHNGSYLYSKFHKDWDITEKTVKVPYRRIGLMSTKTDSWSALEYIGKGDVSWKTMQKEEALFYRNYYGQDEQPIYLIPN